MRYGPRFCRRVPDARLLLKYHGLDCRGTAHHIAHQFAAQEIHGGRIELEGPSAQRELLDRYNAVDVALDTYPYSGGLTTCEALWMGVPVVTCPGPTFASRHAFSHLSNVGLTETVAKTPRTTSTSPSNWQRTRDGYTSSEPGCGPHGSLPALRYGGLRARP